MEDELSSIGRLPDFDTLVSRHFLREGEEITDKEMEFVGKILDLRDKFVRWLGGIPRLEKDIGPSNVESNDVYQFRMASVYLAENPKKNGTFLLYYRSPKDMGGAVLAGINDAIDTIEKFKLDPRFLVALLRKKVITPQLFKALLSLEKLDVTVDAIPEGTFVGPNTPVMTVKGPLWQIQLLETVLIQCIDYQSGVATRAAALIEASGGKPLIDFGTRRAPGEQASVLSAFASVKGGAYGVSNTLVHYLSGVLEHEREIANVGTTAHSFTESYLVFDGDGDLVKDAADSELEAYSDWVKYFPQISCVLIDTIDKKVGLRTAIKLYEQFGFRKRKQKIGVRDDSAITAESILMIYDTLKSHDVDNYIVISDNLTPQKVSEIRREIVEARGQSFWDELDIRIGVGTFLARPDPLGFIYKLAEYEEEGNSVPVSKRCGTSAKASFPVVIPYVVTNRDGTIGKIINLGVHQKPSDAEIQDGQTIAPLAERVFEKGRRLHKARASFDIAARFREQKTKLPKEVLADGGRTFLPEFAPGIRRIRNRIQEALQEVGHQMASLI